MYPIPPCGVSVTRCTFPILLCHSLPYSPSVLGQHSFQSSSRRLISWSCTQSNLLPIPIPCRDNSPHSPIAVNNQVCCLAKEHSIFCLQEKWSVWLLYVLRYTSYINVIQVNYDKESKIGLLPSGDYVFSLYCVRQWVSQWFDTLRNIG